VHAPRISELYGINPNAAMVKSRVARTPTRSGAQMAGYRSLQRWTKRSARESAQRKADEEARLAHDMALSRGGDASDAPHPWYVGYQNSASVAAFAEPLAASKRYGLTGAFNMSELAPLKHGAGQNAMTPMSGPFPKFLRPTPLMNEYQPKLEGPPGAWPARSNYVSGFIGKKLPPPEREPCAHLLRAVDLQKEHLAMFTATKKLDATRRMEREFRTTQTVLSGRETRASNLPDSESFFTRTRRVKQWNGLTVIRPDNTLLNSSVEQERREKRKAMRWSAVDALRETMRLPQYRRPGFQAMHDLYEQLAERAAADELALLEGGGGRSPGGLMNSPRSVKGGNGGSPDAGAGGSVASWGRGGGGGARSVAIGSSRWNISRGSFLGVVLGLFGALGARDCNRLFSSFDVERDDCVDYRAVVATLRLRWSHTEPFETKMVALFNLYCDDDRRLPTAALRDVVMVCVATETEGMLVNSKLEPVLQSLDVDTLMLGLTLVAYTELLRTPNHALVAEISRQLTLRMGA
jgi:hypothetical protein